MSRTQGKKYRLSRITVGEGLIPNIEPSFLWLANTEVSHDHTNGVRVVWPVWRDKTQSSTQAPQREFQLEVDVDDHWASAS